MSTTIKLSKATLLSVEMRRQNGVVSNRLKFSALFDRAAAKAIGAEYTVFDSKQEIRTAYKGMELDFEIKEVAVRYHIPKMEDKALDIRSHGADSFKLMRKGDGKKKASKLIVQFRITHIGNAHEMVDWWLQFGGQEGELTLTPQQQELPLTPGKPEAERRQVVADSRFPQPNEHGVYRQSDATSERINVDQKRFARVYVLQIGEKLIGNRPVGEFIASVNWQLGDGGHTEPLSRPKTERLIYGSREAAFLAALSRLAEGMEDYIRPGRSMAEQKAARKIAEWAANLAATRYSGMAAASLAAAGGVQ